MGLGRDRPAIKTSSGTGETADEGTAHVIGLVVNAVHVVDLPLGASQEDLDLGIPLDQVHRHDDGGRTIRCLVRRTKCCATKRCVKGDSPLQGNPR